MVSRRRGHLTAIYIPACASMYTPMDIYTIFEKMEENVNANGETFGPEPTPLIKTFQTRSFEVGESLVRKEKSLCSAFLRSFPALKTTQTTFNSDIIV